MKEIVDWMNENIVKTLSIHQIEKHNKQVSEENQKLWASSYKSDDANAINFIPLGKSPLKAAGDISLIWNEDSGEALRFAYLNTVWVDPFELTNGSGKYQFIIIPSQEKIEDSRIYRRGVVDKYANVVLKDEKSKKVKNGRVDISGIKSYITLSELPSYYTKALLSGLEFKQQEFWKLWKFPRR
jgi:hypothetical protein